MKEYINAFPWSLSAVHDIRKMYLETTVDKSYTILTEEVELLSHALVDEFNAYIQSQIIFYAVDFRDCNIQVSDPNDNTFQRKIRITWRPTTHEALFWGGPADGRQIVVRELWQPYDVALKTIPSHKLADDTEPITFHSFTYNLDGWDPKERRWIFRTKDV